MFNNSQFIPRSALEKLVATTILASWKVIFWFFRNYLLRNLCFMSTHACVLIATSLRPLSMFVLSMRSTGTLCRFAGYWGRMQYVDQNIRRLRRRVYCMHIIIFFIYTDVIYTSVQKNIFFRQQTSGPTSDWNKIRTRRRRCLSCYSSSEHWIKKSWCLKL